MIDISGIQHLADKSIYDIYDLAVNHFDNAVFVELGSYFGGSTIYLASQIKQKNKDIKVYAIDIWQNFIEPGVGGSIFPFFWQNVIDYKCDQIIKPVMLDSRYTAKAFNDESVDFVFIDADHRYNFVYADIRNWLPKVKPGGWLGGHDYNQEVELAVHHIFEDELGLDVEIYEDWCRSFLVRL